MDIFMLKIRLRIAYWEWKDKLKRRKYCSKGFHKLSHSSYGTTEGSKRMRYVHYLKCRYCNYIFFARPEDKKRYLQMTAKERSVWFDFLSRTKLKHLNSGGRKNNQKASASS